MMTKLATALIIAIKSTLPYVSQDRLEVVTNDMIDVVNDQFADHSLTSKIEKLDALAALAAIASHESGLRTDVENCRIIGDEGRSIGLGQLMRGPSWAGFSKKEICSSRKLQFKLTLRIIDQCWAKTQQPDATFRCYASGDPSIRSHAANSELAIYKKFKDAIDFSKNNLTKKNNNSVPQIEKATKAENKVIQGETIKKT